MDKLRYRYYRFIEFINPYEDIKEHYRHTNNEMLYNLVEIKKDWNFEEGSEESVKLNDLIKDFFANGYKPL